MNILTKAIVSNSDMIKNYKACREKAESLGKIFVLKNNQPDAVLFSVSAYERLADCIEYMESITAEELGRFMESLKKEASRKNNSPTG